MTSKAKIARDRMIKGLCAACAEPRESGNIRQCNACLRADRVKLAYKKDDRRKRGRCTNCGGQKEKNKLDTCVECYAKHHTAETKCRMKRREANLCISCGRSRDRERVLCTPCAIQDSEARATQRHGRAASGKCTRCGDRDPEKGRKRCARCNEYSREQRGRRHKKLRNL